MERLILYSDLTMSKTSWTLTIETERLILRPQESGDYENEQWVDHVIYVALPTDLGLVERAIALP